MVKRVARTYILTVSYTSPNPKLSVDIANAYADAYFTDQLNARYEQVKRASGAASGSPDRTQSQVRIQADGDPAVQGEAWAGVFR